MISERVKLFYPIYLHINNKILGYGLLNIKRIYVYKLYNTCNTIM